MTDWHAERAKVKRALDAACKARKSAKIKSRLKLRRAIDEARERLAVANCGIAEEEEIRSAR